MRRHLGWAVLALVSAAAPASAQVVQLDAGTRVRMEAPGIISGRFDGFVFSHDDDTLVVGTRGVTPLRVPLARITRLDVSRGKSGALGAQRGLLQGTLIGLGVGIVTYTTTTNCSPNCGDGTNFHSGSIVGGSTALGAVAGAVIGGAVGHERWERVDVGRGSAFRVSRGRAEVGIALDF